MQQTHAASQTSDLATSVSGVTEFWGSGAVSATLVFAPGATGFGQSAIGTSSYLVWFTLTQPYAYVLDGAFAAVTTDLDSTSQTRYGFGLLDLTNNAYLMILYGEGNDTDLLAHAGVLDAGDYFLASRPLKA